MKNKLLADKDSAVGDYNEGIRRAIAGQTGFIDYYQYLAWQAKDEHSLVVLSDTTFVDPWFIIMQKDSPFFQPLSML